MRAQLAQPAQITESRTSARARVRPVMWRRRSTALVLLAALTLFGLTLRLTGLSFMLPHAWEPDSLVLVRQTEYIAAQTEDAQRDVFYGYYPHLIARLCTIVPHDRAEAAPATVEDHLRAASANRLHIRGVLAALSVLIVPGTWLLARLFLRRAPALLACGLVSTSVLQLWFAQETRPHAVASVFALLAVTAAVHLRRSPDGRAYLLAALALVFAACSLQNGIAVVIPLCAAHVLREKGGMSYANVAFAAILATVAVCVRVYYPFMFAATDGHDAAALGVQGDQFNLSGHGIRLHDFDGRGFGIVIGALANYEPLLALLAVLGVLMFLVEWRFGARRLGRAVQSTAGRRSARAALRRTAPNLDAHLCDPHGCDVHSFDLHSFDLHGFDLHSRAVYSSPVHRTELHRTELHRTEVHSSAVHISAVHSSAVQSRAAHTADTTRGWRRYLVGREDLVVVLAYVVPYFVVIGMYEHTYQRFLIPLLPFAACFGAWALFAACDRIVHAKGRVVGGQAAALLLAATIFLAQAWAAIRLVQVRGQPDTATRAASWIASNLDPARDKLAHSPSLDVPLFRDRESLASIVPGTESLFPWIVYQRNLPPKVSEGRAWSLRPIPMGRDDARAAIDQDALAHVRATGADYAVIEDFDDSGRPHSTKLRAGLARGADLVARFSPMQVDMGDDRPLAFQDDCCDRRAVWWWRAILARSTGPVIEIYRLRPATS